VQVVRADTNDANDSLRRENPLGKIPALILDDGTAVYDSRVIVDYLDSLDTRGILVPPGQRLQVLCQQALADGMMDAAILQVYERRFQPARAPTAKLARPPARQGGAGAGVCRERSLSAPGSGVPHIGEIAQAVRPWATWTSGLPARGALAIPKSGGLAGQTLRGARLRLCRHHTRTPDAVPMDVSNTPFGVIAELIPCNLSQSTPRPPFNIIYSSGTTGEPKGIVQPHSMRWAHVNRAASTATARQRGLLSTPLYSNTTLVVFFPTLAFGGSVVLMAEVRRQARYLAQAQQCASPTPCWCRCNTAPHGAARSSTTFDLSACASSSAPARRSRRAEGRRAGALARRAGRVLRHDRRRRHLHPRMRTCTPTSCTPWARPARATTSG
jgi:acyl-CoA synthetase (AMP-forming)/AMP-acid ligase II